MNNDRQVSFADIEDLRRELSRIPVRWGEFTVEPPLPTGSGTSGCECCECMHCLTEDEAVVTTCDQCLDGAAMTYGTDFGTSEQWPTLFGEQDVFFDEDCIWLGPVIEVTDPGYSTGEYRWVKTMAGDGTFWELVFVDGVDVVYQGIYGNYRYEALPNYNCRCDSKLQAVNQHTWPSRDFLNCQICDIPRFDNICTQCHDFCFCLTVPSIEIKRYNGVTLSGTSVLRGATFIMQFDNSYHISNPGLCRWIGGDSLTSAQLTVGSGGFALLTIHTIGISGPPVSAFNMAFNVFASCDSDIIVAVFRDNFGYNAPGYTLVYDPPLEDIVFNLTKIVDPTCGVTPSTLCS